MQLRWRQLVMAVKDRLSLDDFRADQVPPDAAQRYRRDQIRGTLEQTHLLILGNTLFATALAKLALPTGAYALIIGWSVLMVGTSWWLFFWTRPLRHCAGDVRDLRRLKIRALLDGFLWSVGMACFYPLATGDGKTIVGILIAGAVALGTLGYSRSVGPGMIYLAVTARGGGTAALVTRLTIGNRSDIFFATLAAIAFLALSKSVLDRGRATTQSFKDLESLSAKTEVVELLLKEYEAQGTEWLRQTDAQGKSSTRTPLRGFAASSPTLHRPLWPNGACSIWRSSTI